MRTPKKQPSLHVLDELVSCWKLGPRAQGLWAVWWFTRLPFVHERGRCKKTAVSAAVTTGNNTACEKCIGHSRVGLFHRDHDTDLRVGDGCETSRQRGSYNLNHKEQAAGSRRRRAARRTSGASTHAMYLTGTSTPSTPGNVEHIHLVWAAPRA